jgi:hypothetical protein
MKTKSGASIVQKRPLLSNDEKTIVLFVFDILLCLLTFGFLFQDAWELSLFPLIGGFWINGYLVSQGRDMHLTQ